MKTNMPTNRILFFALGLILLVAIAALVIASITLANITKNDHGTPDGVVSTTQNTLSTKTNSLASSGTVGPDASSKATPPPFTDLDWWKNTPIYQVYPRSFQDSNGDGTGDLQGIKQRIPYLKDLGIKAIWLSPVYDSPMKDFGYDIRNFTDIAPIFGSVQDFDELLDEVHKNGMYLIMDFVPNHSSNEHDWFLRSERNESEYKDYYVWRNERNNWLSNFGNSSWEWSEIRQQYYLHQFLIEQPDLNYRNDHVKQEMLNTMTWWVDRGVDGFRIDAILYLVEDDQFRDEPPSGKPVPPNDHGSLLHNYTQDLPETYDIVQSWTKRMKQYEKSKDRHIFTCTEGYTTRANVMQYYAIGVDFPFNFNLIGMDGSVTTSRLRKMIRDWMDFMPAGGWPNWVLGNHDQHRIASRLGGRQYIDIANMLLLLLPGTPTCYYGDEIGMIDAKVSYEEGQDPAGTKWGPELYANYTRDPERTPMQWSSANHAGFTKGNKTWLPLGDDWKKFNVEEELKDPNSHLNIFKALVKLRQEPVFHTAVNMRLLNLEDENVFAFTREMLQDRYLIILNFGHDGQPSVIRSGLGIGTGKVVIRSANGDREVDSVVDFTKEFVISDAHGYVIKLDKC